MEILGYLAAVLMGISLGMIGGGGSILTVPILVYLFKVEPILATAYSLFIVGLTALAGGFTYLKKSEVDLKTGVIFAVPSFIGVYLTRAYVVPNLPDPVFSTSAFQLSKPMLVMLVFAILMLAASISMIKEKTVDIKMRTFSKLFKLLLIGGEGLVVGSITGFVGAGGGFLIIPALVVLVGLPMKIAIGTSLFIISVKSLFGFLGDLQHNISVDWNLLLTISSIAILGLLVGVRLSQKISEKYLKRGFGYFVMVMGFIILLDQINKI